MCNCVLPSHAFWESFKDICFINRYIHCAFFQLSRLWGSNCFQHTSLHQNHQEHPQNQPIFLGFDRKNPVMFFVKPTSCNPPSLPDPKKTPQKAQQKIHFHQNWTSPLWACGPCWIHRCETRRWPFLLRYSFKVLTVDLPWMRYVGGTWFGWKIQGLKMCKWWEVCVFDSDEALGESFKKSPSIF